jgi:hypothetical protein
VRPREAERRKAWIDSHSDETKRDGRRRR